MSGVAGVTGAACFFGDPETMAVRFSNWNCAVDAPADTEMKTSHGPTF